MQICPVSGGNSLPDLHIDTFLLCPHTEGNYSASCLMFLLIRPLSHHEGPPLMTSSKVNYLSEALSSNAITFRLFTTLGF